MIRLQIVERAGANLFRTLIHAMRSGDLRTFVIAKRGKRVTHRNPGYSGWISWSDSRRVISCEILSPRTPGNEWRLLSALIGRLADGTEMRARIAGASDVGRLAPGDIVSFSVPMDALLLYRGRER